jgi:hypothetical protein
MEIKTIYVKGLTIASLMLSFGVKAATPPATLEEMWQVIQSQQEQIEALQQQLQNTDAKVEATGEVLEEQRVKQVAKPWTTRTHFGGYGELHFNDQDTDKPGGEDKEEIDLHRFVLNFGYDFDDRTRFYSEVAFKHDATGDGESGEVEVEQAYLDFDLNERHTARGGVFLIPVGILNETHEPPTFYGVERNPVETNIIPTTWWEGGAALYGQWAPGWSYDLALHTGLKVTAATDFAVRSGRQKVAEADADTGAGTVRVRWTGIPGVELAATLQWQNDIAQTDEPGVEDATLFEAHASLKRGPYGLKALYARWDLNGSAPAAVGADVQMGWYVEPSYRFSEQFGVFVRYNEWDNKAGNGGDSEFNQLDAGFNYWPHPNVVIKADYQLQNTAIGEDNFDGYNLGIGYQF